MLEDTERYGERYGAGLSVAVEPEQSFPAGCRPDGNVCRRNSIEWKSRSRDSGVGAETKLVLRSDSVGRRA